MSVPHTRALAAVFALVAAGAAAPLLAAGTVTGTVTTDGIPLPGVVVTVGDLKAITDFNGRYNLESTPTGTQTVTARAEAFRSQSQSVTVPDEGSVTLDFTLTPDLLYSESMVVTGTRNPLTKQDSSVAITTMTGEQIQEREPRSTADLLKAIPGFYVESSGGEVGNNLWARGLPADGSYRYVALMEDGMPVFDSTELFFVNADIFVRIDENIDELEAVRGGNAALFGSNAPGGVVNLLTKTGGNVPETLVRLGAGTDGLWRVGFNSNGPLGEDWRYSLGGFYRFDDGVRDPGFPGSRGGQLKLSLTRNFDNGYVRAYLKYLSDRNVFFLPLPFRAGGEFVDGFPFEGTLHSPEGNHVRVPLPNNEGLLTLPLEDGQKQDGFSATGELYMELPSGWALHNVARVMSIDHQWNAIVPFDLVRVEDFLAANAGPVPGSGPGQTVQLSFTNSDEPFSTQNGLLLLAGLWHVEKPMTNFSDQFQLSKRFGTHDFSIGAYVGHYEVDNVWYFNDILTDVRDQPRFVDATLVSPFSNPVGITENGFRRYGSLFVDGTGDVDVAAFFIGDQIELTDELRLDLGARFESNTYRQTAANTTTFDLGDPTTLADDFVSGALGSSTFGSQSFDEWALSVGINYAVSDQVALWGRASRGYKMPILDNYLFGPTADLEAESIVQFEVGTRVGTPKYGINVSGYFLQIEDFPSQDARVVDGETVFVTDFVGQAETSGVEAEFVARPVGGLRINVGVTAQLPEYTDFIEGVNDLSGNRIRRIPELITDLGVGYHWARVSLSGTWQHIGDRWSNNANTIELPAFDVVSFRAAYDISQQTTLSLATLNAFNSKGLTEGNPRLDEDAVAAGVFFLARPVLPRRATLTLEFRF